MYPPPRYFWWLIVVKAGMSTPTNLALCASPHTNTFPSDITVPDKDPRAGRLLAFLHQHRQHWQKAPLPLPFLSVLALLPPSRRHRLLCQAPPKGTPTCGPSEPGLNCQECSTFCFTGHYVPPPRYFWWLIFVTAAMSTPSNLALCASPPSSVTQTPSHLTAHCPTKTLEPGDFCPSSTNIDSSGKRRLYPYLSYLC